MTLLISDEDAQRALSMAQCIEAMEQALVEEARGIAVSHPRQRFSIPRHPEVDVQAYMGNIIAGAVPSQGVAALRYDSTLVRERDAYGKRRLDWMYPSRRSWGLVLLFSLETGEPLAIMHDFGLSPIRVGATTAVAIRALARKDGARIGLFGSGNEARRHLEALCQIRTLAQVTVYSPTREHRDTFAEEMSEQLGLQIQPVDEPRRVVEGADVVLSCTSASEPVFDGQWLEPGQLVVTIANSTHVHRRTEADTTTMVRSDFIVLNSKETVLVEGQRELLDPIDQGLVSWDKVTELGKVLIGEHPGRTRDDQIIYYKSNVGLGIQFAASGALIYRACKEAGMGRELPTEWFGADVGAWLDKGFLPSA